MPGLRGGARVHVTEFSPLIEVTPECNLRCSYCYYTDRMDEFPDFQPEYIDPDVVRAVYESGWQQLYIVEMTYVGIEIGDSTT